MSKVSAGPSYISVAWNRSQQLFRVKCSQGKASAEKGLTPNRFRRMNLVAQHELLNFAG